mmetsp:Transcript_6044/g.6947  ORF Transcript_6044/g.6947 Transcript_6044/m.6947 type:complete len:110 (+) Transcript_6044:943-1272(+)
MIPNPEYKGEWKPKQLDNPEYDAEVYAFDDIGAVGFELWVVNSGSIFDNIFVGNSLDEAKAFAAETFEITKKGEKDAKAAFDEANKETEEETEEETVEVEIGETEEKEL